MDEQAVKVLARFTEVGQLWPVNAWIYFINRSSPPEHKWYKIKDVPSAGYAAMRVRYDHEISELEANSRGFYRENPEVNSEK